MAPLPKSTARQHYAFLLSLFSTLVISFSLFTYFMLLPLSQFTTHHKPSPSNTSLVPADLHALQTSSKIVQFAEHDAYKNLSHQHDHLWHEALPPNGGYFTLAHERNKTHKLGIAMFHQLHCLAMLRSEMQYLHQIIAVLKDPTRGELPVRPKESDPLDHDKGYALHCFDYLRQSLLCMADATIEQPKLSDDGDPYIDGMDERRCKDWEILYNASVRSDVEPVMPDDLR
ncbi:hypothetical protein VFPPC_10239 [Pochonia chlamydosporia 170]|uniref:Tat pathway signal sequence n=1 Tax=Pochonia chlamydosporia 170 TaxID=1380566 RepID=A0A179F290_METCM|nr:hypothetical protein VFPPC_10239 [Pochonia chlamydosporia 170]OAQ59209.1 hypothetical protein VFPPC_10239 [Pochonia chlamydosporia 170]